MYNMRFSLLAPVFCPPHCPLEGPQVAPPTPLYSPGATPSLSWTDICVWGKGSYCIYLCKICTFPRWYPPLSCPPQGSPNCPLPPCTSLVPLQAYPGGICVWGKESSHIYSCTICTFTCWYPLPPPPRAPWRVPKMPAAPYHPLPAGLEMAVFRPLPWLGAKAQDRDSQKGNPPPPSPTHRVLESHDATSSGVDPAEYNRVESGAVACGSGQNFPCPAVPAPPPWAAAVAKPRPGARIRATLPHGAITPGCPLLGHWAQPLPHDPPQPIRRVTGGGNTHPHHRPPGQSPRLAIFSWWGGNGMKGPGGREGSITLGCQGSPQTQLQTLMPPQSWP